MEPTKLYGPRDLTLVEDMDHPGDWRVEYFDSDGAYYITIFMGRMAQARARDYYEAMTHGGINNRIADVQARGPFKLEWTHTVSQAVSAEIIPWSEGRLGVAYHYTDGSSEAHPIGSADWPIISRHEQGGTLDFQNNDFKECLVKLRERAGR